MWFRKLFDGLNSHGSRTPARRKPAKARSFPSRRLWPEQLEDRLVPATLTVTGAGDAIAVDGLVTLREAIMSANDNANVNADVAAVGAYGAGANIDTINFNIAGAGVKTISPTSGLPTITGPTIIDGYTQPGASANTLAVGSDAVLLIELNGANSGLPAFGLIITAGSSTVRGMIINRFENVSISLQTNGGNSIEGNWIGLNASGTDIASNYGGIGTLNGSENNTIGGTTPQARNVLTGNKSSGINLATSNNVVQGNYIGTDPAGTALLQTAISAGRGVQIDSASGNTIGGAAVGAGNVFAGRSTGIYIFSTFSPSSGNVVQGNFIGTNAAGTAALGNLTGITLGDTFNGVNNTTVGGTVPGAGNLISGNNLGITMVLGTGNLIQGNRIGTAADGISALGNELHGIEFVGGSNNTVGGIVAGAANIIAFNGAGNPSGDGLNVGFTFFGPAGTGNSILGNTIHSNSDLGIDVGSSGVTPNDLGDGDTGPNNLQNFPVLTRILASATQTEVLGTLDGTAGGTFRIEFFVSQFPNATSYGEGQTFLNSVTVTDGGPGDTDPTAGNVSILFTALGDFRGQYFSMTATNVATGDTSEFSLAYAVTTYVVRNTADSGPGSLRAAIINSNRVPNIDRGGSPEVELDQITFNIPGAGVRTIATASAFPVITEPIIVDGYSQPGSSPNTNLIDQASNAVLRIELVGGGATFGYDGLTFAAGGSTVRGLAMNKFSVAIQLKNVGGNRVVGNYLGTDAAGSAAPGFGNFRGVQISNDVNPATNENNTIGGTSPADRNVIGSGGGGNDGTAIEAAGTSRLTVQGNFIGTDATGTSKLFLGSALQLSRITDSLIGGTDPQARNVINSIGQTIGLGKAQRITIQGNYIGTDRTGTVGLVNQVVNSTAIAFFDSSDNLIGGAEPGAGNVISSHTFGIQLGSTTPRHTIQGNKIGTDVTGTLNLGNSFAGISGGEVNSDGSLIGGTVPGAGNTIAFNGVGILISGQGSAGPGTAILGNSIFGNVVMTGQFQTSGLGIDLGAPGPTPNDAGDPDTGGNRLQNYPVITGVASNVITATLNSTANTTFRIEFFASPAGDPSGFGEGQTFLGVRSVTTDASGNANIDFTSATSLPGGQFTATATDPENNTSEFSAVFMIANSAPTVQFSSATFSGNENAGTAVITVTRTGDAAIAFTVDFATSNGTAAAGSDYTTSSGKLSFGAGEMSKTFAIAILDDAAVEGNETVNLVLQNPTGGAILGAQVTATLTILDNDVVQPVGQIAFSAATNTVGEGGGIATITLTRTGGSAGSVSVSLNPNAGTATAGADFNGTAQQVTWAAGDTAAKTVFIPIVQDSLVEGNETVNLSLSNPTGGASLGSQSSAVLTIVDDDETSPPVRGSIAGRVFHDYNANGTEDNGEASLTGMTIFLDGNNNGALDTGEASFLTGNDGRFMFVDLDPGTYVLRQSFVPDHGIVLTSAPALTMTLSVGANLGGKNFANVLISQVSPVEVAANRFPASQDIETAYIHGLYVNVLHREPEAGVVASWVGLLKSGSNGLAIRQVVVRGFWQSAEHRGLQVDHFYATYLHRNADADGRAFHVQQFLNGASEATVVTSFLVSLEYQNTNGSADAFVAALYSDVLSRPAQPGDVAAGVQQLLSMSRSDFARNVIQSDESYLRIVESYYVVYLHRPAEEGGRNFWLNLMRGQYLTDSVFAAYDNSPAGLALQFLSGDPRIQEYVLTAQNSVE